MTDAKNFERDFKKSVRKTQDFLSKKLPTIVGTEALDFVADNFQAEGFKGASGTEDWQERKVVDNKGNDKRYHKRGRKQGRLTRFGEKEKGRNILVGHDSGSNHMSQAFHAEEGAGFVDITNDKEYATFHNDGTDDMAQRQMIGPSPVLDEQVEKQITKHLDSLMP